MTRRDLSVFSPATVGAIWDRAMGACERCGRGLAWEYRNAPGGAGWSVHHRAARGRGGSRTVEWVGAASNGVVLCGSGTEGCHGWVESNRRDAVALGLIVSRNGRARPEDIPVTLHHHGLVKLTADGGCASL